MLLARKGKETLFQLDIKRIFFSCMHSLSYLIHKSNEKFILNYLFLAIHMSNSDLDSFCT
jgi:hypothetical protein